MQENQIPQTEVNQSFSNPVIQTEQQPKQNNFLVVLLSILLIISVSITGFFAFQTQKLVKELTELKAQEKVVAVATTEPVATESSEVDPTANWKMYTNKALGFELKYPSTFTIDKEMNDQYNKATIFKNGNSTFEVMLRAAGEGLDKYYYMDNPDFTKSTLGGKNANVYVYDAGKNSCVSDGTGPGCPVSYIVYVAQNGSNLYHLGFFDDSNLSTLEKQILSTFKFIN